MSICLLCNPIIKCLKCKKKYEIDKDYMEYSSGSIGEYGMGDRIETDFTFDMQCERCGQYLYLRIMCFEYPIGCFENQDYETKGCDLICEPEITPDFYDFDIPEYYEDEIANDVSRLIEEIKLNPSVVYRISDREFEELVAEVFHRNGYKVKLTPPKKDGGKDVIATRNVDGIPICLYIECKHYNVDDPVGVGIVRSVAGVRDHDRVNKAIIVTTSRFTKGAFAFANEDNHMIQLMDLNDLLTMLR